MEEKTEMEHACGKKTIFFDLDDTLYDRSVPYCSAFAAFSAASTQTRLQTAFERTMLQQAMRSSMRRTPAR